MQSAKFTELEFPQLEIYIASFVNCWPMLEQPIGDPHIDLYCQLSADVHDLLYKFNSHRLQKVLDHDQFWELILWTLQSEWF